jgi:hypothetical protein
MHEGMRLLWMVGVKLSMLIPRLVKIRHLVQKLDWLGGKRLCFLKNVEHHLKVLNPVTLRCSWRSVCTQTHAPEANCFTCIMASLTVQVTSLADSYFFFFFVERAFTTFMCLLAWRHARHVVGRNHHLPGSSVGVATAVVCVCVCVCVDYVALEAANWGGMCKLLRRALKLR